jgi:plastocyanin
MLAARPARLAVALVASFALSACGGGSDRIVPNAAKATPVDVPSVPATVYPAPTTNAPSAPASSGAATASATPSKAAGNTVIATSANKFEPGTLTVKKGTKVTWTAEGFHSANSGDGAKAAVDAKGPIQAPMGFKTYSVTFDKPGTYPYFCQPHATLGMVGEIVVT